MKRRKSIILIEGRNFYASSKQMARGSDVQHSALRDLIVQRTDTELLRTVYYMGFDPSKKLLSVHSIERIHNTVESLEGIGFTVRQFPLRARVSRCSECDAESEELVEKMTDSAITCDALSARDEADVFVLVTTDSDLLPLVEYLKLQKKEVWIVAWKLTAVPSCMAAIVDNILTLEEHRDKILCPEPAVMVTDKLMSTMLSELGAAEQKFTGGYVGLHYFLTTWKSEGAIPRSSRDRSAILNSLLESGQIQQYVADDGKLAIRVTK